jgi:type I restriction enzyme S subunit
VFHKDDVLGADLGAKNVFEVVPNTLLLNIVFAWEGAVAVTTEADSGFIASHRFPMFEVDPRAADLSFLRWFLLSHRGIYLLNEHSPGAAGRNRTLNRDRLLREKIRLPDLTTQRRIARQLDALASAIACKKSLADALADRLRVLSADEVFGWNGGRPQQSTGIDSYKQIPRDWRLVRNKVLLAETGERCGDEECELLTVSHLTGITPRSEKLSVSMFLAESFEDYKRVRPQDVAVNTMWAWMGAVGISATDGIVSPSYNVYRFRARAAVVPRYFDYLWRTPQFVLEMNRHSKGIWESRLRLYPEQFLNLWSPLPPVSEQQAIVERLDEHRRRIQNVLLSLDELEGVAQDCRNALLRDVLEAA